MEPSAVTPISYYSVGANDIRVLIPRKNGNGFYKSVFGFHTPNRRAEAFDRLKPRWFCKETADMDGYILIAFHETRHTSRFREGLSLTVEALKQTFPYVAEFRNDSGIFWNELIKQK